MGWQFLSYSHKLRTTIILKLLCRFLCFLTDMYSLVQGWKLFENLWMVIGSVRIPTECNVVHCTNLQLIWTAMAHSVNCFFFWSSNGTVCELRFFLEQQWCSQCFSFLPFVALTWCSCLDTEPISSYSFSRLSCTLIFINSRLWVYYFWEKILLV
jgi:hypothetical protein